MKTNLYFLIPLLMIAVGCTSEGIDDLSGDEAWQCDRFGPLCQFFAISRHSGIENP